MRYVVPTFVRRLLKATALAAAFFGVMAPHGLQAQQAGSIAVRVDSVLVTGNQRLQTQNIVQLFAVQPGQEVSFRNVQRGIKALRQRHQAGLDIIP